MPDRPTPLVDAAAFRGNGSKQYVNASFARTLERDRGELMALLIEATEELRGMHDSMKKAGKFPNTVPAIAEFLIRADALLSRLRGEG